MAANTLRLEIVTPEENIFSGDVDMVTIPGADGEFGVYPLHVPIMTPLVPGELKISEQGKSDTYLAMGEGFVEVTADSVSILTDMATYESQIDEAVVQAAIERAQQRIKEERLGGEELAIVQASLNKSLAKIGVKRRRRSA